MIKGKPVMLVDVRRITDIPGWYVSNPSNIDQHDRLSNKMISNENEGENLMLSNTGNFPKQPVAR